VRAGTYNNFSIKMCHTPLTALTKDFNANYGGKTPVEVYKNSSQYVNATPYSWFGIPFAAAFDYNGSDNFIIEVSWSGDSGGYAYNYWGPATARCVYNVNGGTLYLYNYLHYMRISIGSLGVSPTSLGRVKALYN
jgi:hypothetical protein